MSNLIKHAENELKLAGLVGPGAPYDGMVSKAVMMLVRRFSDQGHSGMSAEITLKIFTRVAAYKVLSKIPQPKEGDYEVICDERTNNNKVLQHKRWSSLFSNDSGKHWHDIDAKRTIWDRLLGRRFHRVTFPYMP